MNLPSDVRYVSDAELRRLFNEGDYEGRIESAELFERLDSDSHPSPPRILEPTCTRSQLVAYLDRDGIVVVRVHRYLRPDGTLGASGRPDPKYLVREGVIYKQG